MGIKYPLDLSKEIKYEGVMKVDDIQKLTNQFFMDRGYDRYDKRNTYLTTKKGRLIEIETRYEKQYSDDDLFEITVNYDFADIKPVTITVDGKKQQMEEGRAFIRFETFMKVNETGDLSGSAIKAMLQFLGYFFLFKHHYDDFKKDAEKDTNQLYDKILHFLNGGSTI